MDVPLVKRILFLFYNIKFLRHSTLFFFFINTRQGGENHSRATATAAKRRASHNGLKDSMNVKCIIKRHRGRKNAWMNDKIMELMHIKFKFSLRPLEMHFSQYISLYISIYALFFFFFYKYN